MVPPVMVSLLVDQFKASLFLSSCHLVSEMNDFGLLELCLDWMVSGPFNGKKKN